MRKLFILSATVAAIAAPVAAQAQRAPAAVIVVVDSDRIYRECNACRTAQQQLQTQVTALQNRQQTLATQLRTEGQSLQTAVQALGGKQPDEALRKRVQDFQAKQEQAQQELARMEQNIQSIRANVVRQIDERMRPVISQVMTQRGANIALDVNATLAHGQGTNVTDAVLAALNSALPSVSVTPLPQQQQQQQPQGR